VQLTVGKTMTLLLNIARDFDSTRHVFTCRLLSSGGSAVSGKNIMLSLNSTRYTSQQYSSLRTNATGYAWIPLYLSPQANNNQTTFNVVASFSGDTASTAAASMTTLNGTAYTVCTTTQYNSYEPSSNSTAITVTLQTTTGATTLMNPSQMEDYMSQKNLVRTVMTDEFSLFPPFFKVDMKIVSDSLNLVSDCWLGVLGGGVNELKGLENLLLTIYDVPPEMMQSIYKIVIGSITTAVAIFLAGMVTTELTMWSLAYIVTLAVYAAVWGAIFLGAYSLLDVYEARAILLTIGFTLMGAMVGIFCQDWLANWEQNIVQGQIGGTPLQQSMIEGTVGFLSSTFISTVILLRLGLTLNVLDQPFMWLNFLLGAIAIGMALLTYT
jgi:hypothetical protein